ncbi:MAG: YggS family pyridoxal phosphate-dependent enzyme [Deltaproteobacteria bacterium]|nr:YggS family pyridoxal phosphate-dependent enzyme [Deltaproteobacteria bacterium]MBW2122664.1 YggS family pyridoxal phosphate-dependent enzyme [Deltaproteobacteria bacterium]
MSLIRENVLRVKEAIDKAAQRVGRNPAEVRLVGASKTVDVERIKAAIEAGVTIFGENYVQEAARKIEALAGQGVSWHLIGHLQKNKARHAVRLFDMIHSVDSVSLAEELEKRARLAGRRLEVLVEVNLSGETTKWGVREEEVIPLIGEISRLPNLSFKGLMTMPPFFDDPEDSRPYFVRLRTLGERIVSEKIHTGPLDLSMGMSNDFAVAVEEGATLVRVGTAIFGPRPLK